MKSALLLLASLTGILHAGEWVDISDPVTRDLKPGYAGPTAGVTVDPVNGRAFLVVNDLGLWQTSDHGATFAQCSGQALGGRCETGWALQGDPAGKRLACFMIYGDSAMTTDGGLTWSTWKTSHLDFGAVDWRDTGRRLLAIRHESGGMLTTSTDAGGTWQDLGKGFSGCGVVDKDTFLTTKEKEPGIFRSTDAGVTWSQVHPATPSAAVPVLFGDAIWWPTGTGVLMSRDKGLTWQAAGSPVDATHGPFFATATHFTVAGKAGFQETKDGGTTWQKAAPLPDGFGITRVGPCYAWDPKADIFYASTMTRPTFRYERK